MEVYSYELTVEEQGTVKLDNLPFAEGAKIDVIIIPRTNSIENDNPYPLKGLPITYIDPTEPVALEDWETLK